jgi:predicted amidohydrolase YtcJ
MTARAAELLLVNGSVHTVDPSLPTATVVAVRDGRIVAVGGDDVARDLRGPRTETIDVHGRTVLPGFQDAHAHPSDAGLGRSRCDLSQLEDADAYVSRVAGYAAEHAGAEWIVGGGWAMAAFPGGVPSKEALDRAVPDRPVFLQSLDGHSAWLNSAALARAGIDERTPDPADGRIERDARGEPLGALQEGAMELVQRIVPAPTTSEIADGLLEAQGYLHGLGITAWQEAIVGDTPSIHDCFDAYLALDRAGSLTGRVVGALWWARDAGDRQLATLLTRRERAASSCGRFRASSVKFMVDGICENLTASMLRPYLDREGHETHTSGRSFFEPEELAHFVTLVDAEGFQAHFHVIGDRAVREALDAVEAAMRVSGRSDARHCAAHIQVVHPDDVVRFAALGVIANGQPLWACNDPQMVELTLPVLGQERSAWQYPFASLVRSGARLCFGSDWPVSTPDVLAQVHVAVNRTAPPGEAGDAAGDAGRDVVFLPDERLDLGTALGAFTMGSAYANHLDQETGSVTVGKRADLVVLDRDVFSAPSSEIGLARVDVTFVDGVIVHAAPSAL